MTIPLDAVRENGHNVRRVAATTQADAALLDSVRAQGVLVPILVRSEDGAYLVIAGHRRVTAARAAGLTEIPALVMDGLVNGHATAAQAAENMVRAPMHPVDQWRAIVQLQAEGFALPAAAAALGLSERFARRLDRLGNLHEDILALIEAAGLPNENTLRDIALAPPPAQRKAARVAGAVERAGSKVISVNWWMIHNALRGRRVSRELAIFDTGKVKITWDEDLFAEPGSAEQFTTAEVDRFLMAQQAALEKQIEARVANKERVRLADYSERGALPMSLPAGWSSIRQLHGDDRARPKTTEAIFFCVASDGRVLSLLAVDTKAEKEREKAAAAKEKVKAKAAASESVESSADSTDNGDEPAASSSLSGEPKTPFTKKGLELIGAAKTAALRAHLRSDAMAQRPAEDLLRLLILALGCLNVQVASDEITWRNRNFHDLAGRLLLPGGQIDPHTMPELPAIAAEAIARIVTIARSGDAAEWIGAAACADEELPRFDTEAFLQHVNGDELRRAATEAGVKAPAKVSAMREALVDLLPNWRPAAFGAPAPLMSRTNEGDC